MRLRRSGHSAGPARSETVSRRPSTISGAAAGAAVFLQQIYWKQEDVKDQRAATRLGLESLSQLRNPRLSRSVTQVII
jgi:hypothetical protein